MLTRIRLTAKLPCHYVQFVTGISCSILLSRPLLSNIFCLSRSLKLGTCVVSSAMNLNPGELRSILGTFPDSYGEQNPRGTFSRIQTQDLLYNSVKELVHHSWCASQFSVPLLLLSYLLTMRWLVWGLRWPGTEWWPAGLQSQWCRWDGWWT